MKNSPAGKSKSLKINLDIYVYKYYDFFTINMMIMIHIADILYH